VCRFLIDWGVLSRVVGDEEAFVSHKRGDSGDALYDVHRRVLAGLLACARGPSTFAPGSAPDELESRLHALVDEFVADGPEARRTALRHALARRLLDDPVVYFDELDSESREYFVNQRGPLCARLADASGLTPEQRAEGAALIDADGELSDARLPAEGTLSHATLLVAEYLAKALSQPEQRSIAETEVAVFLRHAADEYGRYWRKAEREPGAESALAREVLEQLRQLRLILWEAMPCAHARRWRALRWVSRSCGRPNDPRSAPGQGKMDAAPRFVERGLEPGQELPAPARTRWQPLRIGLVELFHMTRRSSGFAMGICCFAATMAPANPRCSR
jgi:uncharacterized protein (TIGR02678 family)